MKNLEDLRKRKETLRKEIAELEDIAAFKNPKESLNAITHGFTDQFLVDKTDENGEHRLNSNQPNFKFCYWWRFRKLYQNQN